MIEQVIHETLGGLAERYIPAGKHKFLHVKSREAWTNLMLELIESGAVRKKLSLITKCAMNWEALLIQKISIQN
jgi:hypothetical protein